MSNGDNSLTINDLYDCFFTCTRNQIKRTNKKYRILSPLVENTTALLAKITIISMLMASGLNMFEEYMAKRCGYGSYQTPFVSEYFLRFSFVMIVLERLCRCLKKEFIPLPRLLSLFCYNAGIVVIVFYLPQLKNSSCAAIRNAQLHTGNHPLIWDIGKLPSRSKARNFFISCELFGNHYAVQFLRTQLDILWSGCGVTWIVGFILCCRYLINICKTSGLQTPAIPADPSSISNVEGATSFCISPAPLFSEISSEEAQALLGRSIFSPQMGAIAGAEQIVQVDIEKRPANVESSSESSSDSVFLPPSDESYRSKFTEYRLQTGRCMACKRKQPRPVRESIRSETSTSEEALSRDEPRSSSSSWQPLISQNITIPISPRRCQYCKAWFTQVSQ